MDFEHYSQSRSYYDFFEESVPCRSSTFDTLSGRIGAFKTFFKIACVVPLSILYKAYKTTARVLGVGISVGLLFLTLGISSGVRALFERRVLSFCRDLMDWVVFPFAVVMSLGKLLLASLLRPSFFFRF